MFVDLLAETWRSLRVHKLRFGLTSLGIVWGIFTLTYLQASTDGFDEHYHTMLRKAGTRVIALFPGVVLKERVGERGSRDVKLEMDDLARLERLESIESTTPNLWVGKKMFRAEGRTKVGWVYGVSASALAIRNFEVASGRFLSARDVRDSERVVFMGSVAAERIFGAVPAVGKTLHIESIPFRVIGVSKPKGEQMVNFGPDDDQQALIPVSTAQRWFTLDDSVGEVLLRPRTAAASWGAIEMVRAIIGLHHDFEPDADSTALNFFNVEEVIGIVRQIGLGMKIFFMATGLITLMVGAIGVMNIMLVVVGERTREIGLRKAIGASNAAVFSQFLAEALAITGLSGLLGVFLGWALVAWGQFTHDPNELRYVPQLHLRTVWLVAATLGGVGVLAGLLPALRAMRVEPAIALRQL